MVEQDVAKKIRDTATDPAKRRRSYKRMRDFVQKKSCTNSLLLLGPKLIMKIMKKILNNKIIIINNNNFVC